MAGGGGDVGVRVALVAHDIHAEVADVGFARQDGDGHGTAAAGERGEVAIQVVDQRGDGDRVGGDAEVGGLDGVDHPAARLGNRWHTGGLEQLDGRRKFKAVTVAVADRVRKTVGVVNHLDHVGQWLGIPGSDLVLDEEMTGCARRQKIAAGSRSRPRQITQAGAAVVAARIDHAVQHQVWAVGRTEVVDSVVVGDQAAGFTARLCHLHGRLEQVGLVVVRFRQLDGMAADIAGQRDFIEQRVGIAGGHYAGNVDHRVTRGEHTVENRAEERVDRLADQGRRVGRAVVGKRDFIKHVIIHHGQRVARLVDRDGGFEPGVAENDFVGFIGNSAIYEARLGRYRQRHAIDHQRGLKPLRQQRFFGQVETGSTEFMRTRRPEHARGAAAIRRPGQEVRPAAGAAYGAVRKHELVNADFGFARVPLAVIAQVMELANRDLDVVIEAELDEAESVRLVVLPVDGGVQIDVAE